MKVEFCVYGEPVAKARPRVRRMSQGNVVAYTPKKTADYEEYIRLAYKEAGGEMFPDEPLRLEVECDMGIPSSVSKKKFMDMNEGRIRPTKRPDIDNLVKTVLGAGNGVIYRDDKQVVELSVIKKYSESPKIYVRVETLGGCNE